MNQTGEAVAKKGGARLDKTKKSKAPLMVALLLMSLLVGGYLGLCGYAHSLDVFYPNYEINGINVSGLTAKAAQAKLEAELPEKVVSIYDYADYPLPAPDAPRDTLLTVTMAELGFSPEVVVAGGQKSLDTWAQESLSNLQQENFFKKGLSFFKFLTGKQTGAIYGYYLEGDTFDQAFEKVVDTLFEPAVDGSYALDENNLYIVKARDGRTFDRDALKNNLSQVGGRVGYSFDVEFSSLPSMPLTAQEIHDEISGEMSNATYDKETDSIIPERIGADFDVEAAQNKLDAAKPGETIPISAQLQYPTVTAKDLEALLFRDLLGECSTLVSGTAARKSNVQLSAASINEYIMNPGDVFDYNVVVGQRTAERGYKPAPAYFRGETVDEIGGGICQTSSTLYLAALRSNLEIVERYAHRYVPAYIPWGMDATVSWGGPEFRFANNTDYPIKIVTGYENNYVTVQIYGTNIDGISVKMTNEVVSSTPWETVYEEDPTIPPGTEKVKTSAYTGYLVRTYQTVYDKDGNVIDSHFEATSNYKVRNKVILKAPGELPPDPATQVVNPGGVIAPSQNPDSSTDGDLPIIVLPETPAVTPQETPTVNPNEPIIVVPDLPVTDVLADLTA